MAPGVLDRDVFGFQTLQRIMRMTRTWDSTMSMLPRGGDTIWGGLDWSPEEDYCCSAKKPLKNNSRIATHNGNQGSAGVDSVNYGRIISFGKDLAEEHSSKIERIEFRVMFNSRFIKYF